MEELRSIISQFNIPGTLKSCDELKRGLINDSYISTFESPDEQYFHQRLNRSVFLDIPILMSNIRSVLAHLSICAAEGTSFTVPTLIETKSDQSFYVTDDGDAWRTYTYLSGTVSFDKCTSGAQAFEAGRICGLIESYLFELPSDSLKETIPGFHDLPGRYKVLDDAVSHDSEGRLKKVAAQLDSIEKYRGDADLITSALEERRIPTRITHNDLKFNNVLFDESTARAVSVVDYDTCMPSSVVYDFGNLITFSCVTGAEDEVDLSKISFNQALCEQLVEGFMSTIEDSLESTEIELFPSAPKLFALNEAVRFLTDYLNGDIYFKIERPEQNLDRARARLRAVEVLDRSQEMLVKQLKSL